MNLLWSVYRPSWKSHLPSDLQQTLGVEGGVSSQCGARGSAGAVLGLCFFGRIMEILKSERLLHEVAGSQ